MTTDLSRALPGSFVIARDTAFTYKGQAADVGRLRRELGVRYVLEGSVLLDRDQVRVNARLIDARSKSGIWADRFDTVRIDIFRAQDEIVGRLSRAIGLEVIDVEARRRRPAGSGGPEAMDLVMRARAAANRPSGARTGVAISPAAEEHTGEKFVQKRVGLHHVCFRARGRNDVDAVYALLLEMGTKVVHPPENGPWAPSYYSVLFEDAGGIRLEVNQVPGKRLLTPGLSADA